MERRLDQIDQISALPQLSAVQVSVPPPVLTGSVGQLRCDAEGRIDQEIPCRGCGYNLRGLQLHGVCPECSVPIGRSIRGDLLIFSNPRWVNGLARGMLLVISAVLTSVGAAIVMGVGFAFVGSPMRSAIASGSLSMLTTIAAGVGFIIALVQTFGYWLLTAPDPGTADSRGDRWRIVARYTLLATLVSAPLQATWNSKGGAGNMAALTANAAMPLWTKVLGAVTVSMLLVQLVGYAAMFVYTRRLALRAAKPRVAAQTRIVMWGYITVHLLGIAVMVISLIMIKQMGTWTASGGSGGMPAFFLLFTAVGCTYGLGALVFGIWAIVLMFQYRSAFKNAAAQARSTWARESLVSTAGPLSAGPLRSQDMPPAGATM